MTEWTGITDQRYKQLAGDSTLRVYATEEIWAELNRMRDILTLQRKAHYAMISWGISEGQGDRDPAQHDNLLNNLHERGIGTVEGRDCQ